ncbi:hypothetical protein [Blastopirellula marina]|uniref:Uncharacterized protein n=1 Tax=Blastopirellula marina TaxID=124 RepID=A0A2S8GHS5_9BACT|nr:hypothetical protein [Blastopirellula marina]PQO43871.1 hypothetical protein C5Y93_22055 [Blastopirellula marina]
MAASPSILADKLHEYPQQDLIDGTSDGVAAILDNCLSQTGGVLQLLHRYAGRTFCSPGKRLRLEEKSYYPDYMGGTGLDEIWMCCTVPIVTGVIDTRTGKAPYREGEAHVLTPDGQVISLQDLIAAAPETVMGEKVTAFAKAMFGDPTWPIVSKKFDNLNPIPDHLHWAKWEVYDINSFDNPGVSPSHYHTTAMGLYSWVTKDQFLACMKRYGQGEYNGIRHVAPHVMMQLDNGFTMPNGVLHSPTDLCTHELHVTMDEHFLAEDVTLDGRISAEAAFYACREQDYPKSKHGDWDYLVDMFDFAANQDPDFVLKNARPAITAEEFSGAGVDAKWIVYGELLGEQKCSILRLTLEPGAKTKFCPECPTMFHTNGGSGRVGKLDVRYHQNMVLGQIYPEIGFITQAALNNGGVEIENTGAEPLVLTFDFPQNAHSKTPGVA